MEEIKMKNETMKPLIATLVNIVVPEVMINDEEGK